MQALSKARRLQSVLGSPVHLAAARLLCPSDHGVTESSLLHVHQCRSYSPAAAPQSLRFSGLVHGNGLSAMSHLTMPCLSYSSETSADIDGPTDTVKEFYDKIVDSVSSKRTMAPNAWTWSMIKNSKNHEDIKLLFSALQILRTFRLSNLRIHENFNAHLCREVAKACVCVGAIDFGKKTLWKHNVYGLTPSIASAHHLLQHAKEHNDTKLMVDVMKLLKKNDLSLQPGTADIVFSICYNTDNWELLLKYSKKFVKAGVKLRRASFDIWMDFAAKIGDVQSLWKSEKLRSESLKQHTLVSAISCAKGFLLEGKPEEAAAVVSVLNQILPDEEKSSITVEVQKLVSEWPLDVIKRQKAEDRKAMAATLQSTIPAMVSSLSSKGLRVTINIEDLTKAELI